MEVTTIDKNQSKSEFVRKFTKTPAILEINEYLSLVEIKITSSLDKKETTMVNLEVIGCFKPVKGCILDGKLYQVMNFC